MTLGRDELGPVLASLAELLGAGVQEVRVPDPDRVVLSLRVPGHNHWLLLCAAPRLARVHRIDRAPRNPMPALAFQGLLRKELGGRLIQIARIPDERIARFLFEGPMGLRSLLLEIYGGGGNLALLDGEDRVLGRPGSPRRPGCDAQRGEPWLAPGQRAAHWVPVLPGPGGPEEAIASRYEQMEAETEAEDRLAKAKVTVLRRLKEARRLAARRAADLERLGDPTLLRRRAQLLQGSFHLLARGAREARVIDWEDPEQRAVTLQLDPALAPAEQVRRAFAAASKAERAAERGQQRLDDAALAVLELEELAGGLDDAATPEAVERALGLAPGPRAQRTNLETPRLPYVPWRTAAGVEIRVGRGAADNDALTLRHARGNDVWLHVKGRPGAHVVIRDPGPSPSPELLRDAAQLALVHSGLKDGAREEVAWTRVKYVSKPKGWKPGAVRVTQEKILYLEADRAALDGLTRL